MMVFGVWISCFCGVIPEKSVSTGALIPPFNGVSTLVSAITFNASFMTVSCEVNKLRWNKPGGVVVQDIVIGAGGLEFDPPASQTRNSVANDSPQLRRFFGAVYSSAKQRR